MNQESITIGDVISAIRDKENSCITLYIHQGDETYEQQLSLTESELTEIAEWWVKQAK